MAKKKYSPAELSVIAERLVPIARKQRDASVKYRQPKLDKIIKGEELYFNMSSKAHKGRFNIPLPIVSGFVDANLAKIDDEITINFDPEDDADKIKCRKCNAAIKTDSSATRGMWRIKDLLVKKNAIFSGVGIYKTYSESDPKYKHHLFPIDVFDFHCEATGGWNIQTHLFRGVDNIFRTESDLKNGPQYDQEQVKKLLDHMSAPDYKKNNEIYQNRQNRHKSLGLDVETNNYVGVPIVNLTEWEMVDPETGDTFYMFFEPLAGIWVRIEELSEITGEVEEGDLAKSMFKAWHTHPDMWNFWSKAPVDDVVPIAIAMKIMVNFMFDDVQKRLWGQRLYDPEIITDPSMLEWDRPDKLIMATLPSGKKLSDGVWEFPTGDKSTITINMLDYFRNFVAVESGITPQSKGESDEKLLGIAKINEGEVADRLGLTNIFYTQCYAEIGDAWVRGARMCITGKTLIRMVGENGSESVFLTSDDFVFSSDPTIRIVGGKTEARKNDELNQAKNDALTSVIELFPDKVNAKIAMEHLLANGHWKADEIAPILDVSTDGDEEESVYASEGIRDIIAGKTPRLYTGATTRFMQKIIDFARKNQTNPKMTVKLMKYALGHQKIVIQNMAQKAMVANLNPQNNGGGGPAQQPNQPMPPVPPGNSVAGQGGGMTVQNGPSASAVATGK